MDNIRFESLCHGLASTVQEISLRLVQMTENEKSLRQEVLDCRKLLLECASGLVINAKHPFKAFEDINVLAQVRRKPKNALT